MQAGLDFRHGGRHEPTGICELLSRGDGCSDGRIGRSFRGGQASEESAISALRVLVGNGTEESLAGAHAQEADGLPVKQQFDAALGMAFA